MRFWTSCYNELRLWGPWDGANAFFMWDSCEYLGASGKMALQRCPLQIPRTRKYVLSYGKRKLSLQRRINFVNQLNLKQEEYPGLSKWAKIVTRVFKWGWRRQKSWNQRDGRKIRLDIADFEDGRAHKAKEYGQPLEAGKDKKTDSLLEPSEVNTNLLTPWF